MGNKRMKHLNELRVKAMSGDVLAKRALEQEMFVPHHLRAPDKLGSIHRKIGSVMVESTHITAKTHRGIPCRATEGAAGALKARAERLQMLKDRKERRDARG